MNKILHGDSLIELKKLQENSVDAIVTDPPYGLSFMGKKWDYDVPSTELWIECLRVLKPGGYLLAFAGTRTQHRMAVRIEDAGFEIRDMIAWVYGSGFPKSLNIGKAIDKLQGTEYPKNEVISENSSMSGSNYTRNTIDVQSEVPKEWEGWGTALKPALEPITVARKPLSEKTVAENVLKWGTGGINIDGSRVGLNGDKPRVSNKEQGADSMFMGNKSFKTGEMPESGRFPANFIHDGSEEVVAMFPNTKSTPRTETKGGTGGVGASTNFQRGSETSTYSDSGSASRFFYCAKTSKSERNKGLDSTLTVKYNGSTCKEENIVAVQLLQKDISDSDLMSFSTGESGENIMVQCRQDSLSTILTETNRIIGLKIYSSLMLSLTNESTQGANSEMEIGGNLAENVVDLKRWLLTTTKGSQELALGASRVVLETLSLISVEENWKKLGNFHATVKPIKLMEYLINLVSKEGAVILDPFAGSGSTGIACKNLNRNYVLIERELEYVQIINSRLQYHE